MKAYIKDEHEHKGHFNGHKYRLTISMIVKNEEKNIRRCLDAMKPLLDAVPSELIITDTGSTDNTVEIIKEYTDNIINFSWSGDMAAARNIGLRAAQGEWFLSIDADEWFEDVTDIIHFFNSDECSKYGCASYEIRNYYDMEGKTYAKQDATRIARIYDSLRYEGRMHEALIGRQNPSKLLDSYAHHYGYVYANDAERMEKFNRNVTGLKQEIANFPHELRFIYQIIREYLAVKDYNTAIDWCQKGLTIEKEYPDSIRQLQIQVLLMTIYFCMEQYQMVITIGDEVFASQKKLEVYHTDVCELQMFSYMRLRQPKKAISAGLAYVDIYKKYKAGELDESVLIFGISDGIMPWVYSDICNNLAKCYTDLNEYNHAINYFDKIKMSDINTIDNEVVLIGLTIADNSGKQERIADLYTKIQQTKDEVKQQDFIQTTEIYIRQHKDVRAGVITALAQVESDAPYIQLNKLRAADEEGKKNKAVSFINWFVSSFTDWSAYYSDVLYVAMKQDLDIALFFDLFDPDDLRLYITQMISDHSDFADITAPYFLEHSYQNSLKGLYWSICLCERVVLSSEATGTEQYVACFRNYALNVAAYAHRIYQPELFAEENISVLPRAYRFGHYMQIAFNAKEAGHGTEYIQNMKIALNHYPVMKTPIQIVSEYFEEQQTKNEQQNNEFADLANKVKSQIEQLLLQGMYGEAEAVLAQLAELLPNDEDVKRYRLQIQAVQTSK